MILRMVVLNMDTAQEKASLNSIEDQDHFYVHVLSKKLDFIFKQTNHCPAFE